MNWYSVYSNYNYSDIYILAINKKTLKNEFWLILMTFEGGCVLFMLNYFSGNGIYQLLTIQLLCWYI